MNKLVTFSVGHMDHHHLTQIAKTQHNDIFWKSRFLNQACARFLKIVSVRISVCVSACPPPGPLIISGMTWCDKDPSYMICQISSMDFT